MFFASKHLDVMPRDTYDQYKMILEKIKQKLFSMIFFIIFGTWTPGWSAESAIVVGAKKFWHFVICPGLKRRYLGAQKELEGVLEL